MPAKPNPMLLRFLVASSVLLSSALAASAETTIARPPSPSEELNTTLMHATFLLLGPARNQPGKTSTGTVFVLGVPHKDDPKIADIVLVTAAHVLEDVGGDKATILLRRRNSGDHIYVAFPHELPIRDQGRPLYVRHATADVVAMYADFPDEVPMSGLPPDMLMTDQALEDIEVHPGDEAFVLGFPLAASGLGAFPLLRVGHIMSYPLTPMNLVKRIDFDLFIYPGNSGGPVYFTYVNRMFKGQLHLGVWRGILGLVIQESHSIIPEHANKPLNYGIVVPASFIRETIALLPPRQSEK